MLGMRLGGIDPSILRELSGVYKPFVKAFKELISNAFDADAESVRVEFADDFSSVVVVDDGSGMTPLEFRNDFTRIGGGSRRWAGDRTRKGRLRIGSKGIGFLALARYCGRLEVESAADRLFQREVSLPKTPTSLDLREAIGVPFEPGLLATRLRVKIHRDCRGGGKLKEPRDYKLDHKRCKLAIGKDVGPVTVKLRIDCKRLGFRAVLDFDRLLRLADNADLEKLDDFASIEVFDLGPKNRAQGTRIRADDIKNFVRRELRADRRKGYVRNIASRNGLEQFTWHLSRCTPIPYAVPVEKLPGQNSGPSTPPDVARTNTAPIENARCEIERLLAIPGRMSLGNLEVRHGSFGESIRRSVYPLLAGAPSLPEDMLISVNIKESGVVAKGFLAGYESVIFPAEFRGITIRVRGVAIGDPGFLGAESLLTGASKAALSQITGEINVASGLDAVDTLNPGRESFYEESEHYRVLRRWLVGEGEQIGGYVGQAIDAVLRRSQVSCALSDILGRAALRRRALEDVSAAITHLVARGAAAACGIRKMLKSSRSHANGLPSAQDFRFSLPVRIGRLAVVKANDLGESKKIDYKSERIKIDMSRPEWDQSLLLFDRRFDVIHKKGNAEQPIAELDLKDGRIFVNWGHPARAQMDERGFLRTALAWVLAKEAAHGDTDQMMNLALNLLSFTTQRDG